MRITDILNERPVLLDGAMGTLLEKLSLMSKDASTVYNAYKNAGADVIYADTFSLNPIKDVDYKNKIENAIRSAKTTGRITALDIGSIGKLVEPFGDFPFEQAYECFKSVILAGFEADIIVIETMANLSELRAALLAAKENSSLPVLVSMTFEKNCKTYLGVAPECFAIVAEGLGADIIGVNCSTSPRELMPVVETILNNCTLPVAVKPNAGLPDINGNYSVGVEEFTSCAKKYLDMGVKLVGGCCGTTPDYIAALRSLIDNYKVVSKKERKRNFSPCSYSITADLSKFNVIGERINPTGRKLLKKALLEKDYDYIVKEAVTQSANGADLLDVNVGFSEIDEREMLILATSRITAAVALPLQLDSSDYSALEAALRVYCGRAIINSVNGDEDNMDRILPLAKKYGASIVGLTLDKTGLPKDAEARLNIANRIIERAKDYGICKEEIIIDCLTLPLANDFNESVETLKAIEVLHSTGIKTSLGISNISFGLPNRADINGAFLSVARKSGLDMAIAAANVLSAPFSEDARKVVSGKMAIGDYIALGRSAATIETAEQTVEYCIIRSIPCTQLIKKELKVFSPTELIDKKLIPALGEVGRLYESGKIFLPELMASANVAKSCFDEIKAAMPIKTGKGKIVVATVLGDVHDIGKNLAGGILQSYGYEVIDLGKNVEPSVILDTVIKENVKLVGLSALMTTTAKNMEKTVKLLKEEAPFCKIMVGGAVITEEFAHKIGADFYAKDASSDALYAETLDLTN